MDESDLATNEVALGMSCKVIQPSTIKNTPTPGTPEDVFADLEKRTGLTFKLENRKVRLGVLWSPVTMKHVRVQRPHLSESAASNSSIFFTFSAKLPSSPVLSVYL